MASVEVVAMNGDVGSRHGYDDISYALSLKREEIEKEIEDFKKQKEDEYKQYERSLRNAQVAGGGAAHAPTAQASTASGNQTGHGASRPAMHRRTSSEQRRLNRPNRTVREALNQAFSSSTEEGRDFEGVFTPNYLALIDPKASKEPSPPQEDAREEQAKHDAPASSTLHPPLIYPWSTSSPHENHISSSAPERNSGTKSHHRSDSTNSTMSVQSLRSSLKDPRTPKSPKRVLFSIEDGVVSPSTSPSLSRKDRASTAGEENAQESLLSMAKRTSREKKKKNRRKERGDGDRGRRGRGEAESTTPDDGKLSSSASNPSATDSMPAAQGGDTIASLDGELARGFAAHTPGVSNSAIEDDIFDFDEDLATISRPTSSSSAEDVDLDDEVMASGSKVLSEMGTSPHAGSLPIEIKWPERRMSGGAG